MELPARVREEFANPSPGQLPAIVRESPIAENDLQCMQRLQAGDDLALNDLMRRWQAPLISFIYRFTGNQNDAVDLAQETFVRVYESRGRYRPTGKFATWLFTIAANLCRNLARWKSRHPEISLDGMGAEQQTTLQDTIASPGDSPSDTAERNDLASAIREHIQALPFDLRTVVLLFEYEELSYQEIAGILGCTSKAVETRLYRARKILGDALARWKVR